MGTVQAVSVKVLLVLLQVLLGGRPRPQDSGACAMVCLFLGVIHYASMTGGLQQLCRFIISAPVQEWNLKAAFWCIFCS